MPKINPLVYNTNPAPSENPGILLVLIGMILCSILLQLIVFLNLNASFSLAITIICGIFYLVLLFIFPRRKRSPPKFLPKQSPSLEESVKKAIIGASSSELDFPIKDPKYIASTHGKVYHLIGCKRAKTIPKKDQLSNDSSDFFEKQHYKPCPICLKEKKKN
jgi:hypothetical protein